MYNFQLFLQTLWEYRTDVRVLGVAESATSATYLTFLRLSRLVCEMGMPEVPLPYILLMRIK